MTTVNLWRTTGGMKRTDFDDAAKKAYNSAKDAYICAICGDELTRNSWTYTDSKNGKVLICKERCKRMMKRITKRQPVPSLMDWFEIVRKSWDIQRQTFTCSLTGLPLHNDNPDHALHATADHETPGKSTVNLTSRLINDMKSYQTTDEFINSIHILSDLFKAQQSNNGNGIKKLQNQLEQHFLTLSQGKPRFK